MAQKKKKKVTSKPKYRKPPSNILEIKRKHIIAANKADGRNDPCDCPIAQALKDKFNANYAAVDCNDLQVGSYGDGTCNQVVKFEATKTAKRFMDRYDGTGEAEPTRLRLVKLSEENW